MGDALINYGPITRAGDGQHPIFTTMSSLCSIIVLDLIPVSHIHFRHILIYVIFKADNIIIDM